MEAVAKVQLRHRPLDLSLHHQRPSSSRPISSLSFRTPPPPLPSSSFKRSFSIRPSSPSSSSSLSDPSMPNPKTPKPPILETLNPFPFSLFKTAAIAAVAASAVFFARFNLKPVVAAVTLPPPSVKTSKDVVDEVKEKTLEDHLSSHPDDVQALRDLMEVKIKNQKVGEAIPVVEQLITLEPNDVEWPLMKAHLQCYNGELKRAKLAFNELIEKDPFRVEAYHGLVMVASQSASTKPPLSSDLEKMLTGNRDLTEVAERVAEAIEKCKRENRINDTRDFKLLMAQIRVIEGKYGDALNVYEELVKEEPRDFRPYLCQGMIYTLLRKEKEAEKQFRQYRKLVPKEHPYAKYFNANEIATKIFGQKVKKEKEASKR